VSFSLFLFFEFLPGAHGTGRTARQIWTNEGSKCVVSCKGVPFGERYCHKFWGQTPQKMKFWGVNRTFNPDCEKSKSLLQYICTVNWPSWVVSWLLQTNPRWRTVAILNLIKF